MQRLFGFLIGGVFAALACVALIGDRPVVAGPACAPPAGPATTGYVPPGCGIAWRNGTAPALGNLAAVAAFNRFDVWAAGDNGVMHWNGSTWATMPGAATTHITSLAATAGTDIWALGDSQELLHWNGGSWSAVPYPTPNPTTSLHLNAVAAGSATSAWAVGGGVQSFNLGFDWVERWDGTSWTILRGAPFLAGKPGPRGACVTTPSLNSAAAVGPNDMWAAGTYFSNCTVPATQYNYLRHCTGTTCDGEVQLDVRVVAGAAPNDVWAAGNGGLFHWNGSAWSPVAAPGIGTVNGLTAQASNDVWAVGSAGTIRWNGTTWTQVPNPDGVLQAVDATSGTDVWAVGSDGAGGSLVQHYAYAENFSDVPIESNFFLPIEALACRGILGGYADGTFRPGDMVSRGQLAKLVALSAGLTDTPAGQTYHDVPPTSTFYRWIEQVTAHSIIGGYRCGTVPSEPCDSSLRPYFRPSVPVTRGQMAKTVALAAGYNDTPSGQVFEDVPPTDTFYRQIMQITTRGIVGGYACGGPGEPCVAPANRPYFRPAVTLTRAQTAKILNNTFFAGGPPP